MSHAYLLLKFQAWCVILTRLLVIYDRSGTIHDKLTWRIRCNFLAMSNDRF